MAKHKVTEEDIRLTEALIGQSFGKLKNTVTEAPHKLVRPATSTIRNHPVATTAAAVGMGIVVAQVIKMFTPRVVVKEVPAHPVQHKITVKEGGGQPGSLTSQLMSLAMPYIVGFVQQELSKVMVSRETR